MMKQPFSIGAASVRRDFMWYSAGPAADSVSCFYPGWCTCVKHHNLLQVNLLKFLRSSGMLHPLLMKVPIKSLPVSVDIMTVLSGGGFVSASKQMVNKKYKHVCMCFGFVSAIQTAYRMSYSGEASQVERPYVLRSLPSSDDLFHQRLSWCEHTWQDQRLTVGHTVLSWRCVWLSEWHVKVAALCKKS